MTNAAPEVPREGAHVEVTGEGGRAFRGVVQAVNGACTIVFVRDDAGHDHAVPLRTVRAVATTPPDPLLACEVLPPPEPSEAEQAYRRAKHAEHILKNAEEQERALRIAIHRTNPRWESALKDLAMLLTRRGDYEDALSLLEQLSEPSRKATGVLNLRGEILRRAGRYADAARLYREIRSRPGNDGPNVLRLELAAWQLDGNRVEVQRVAKLLEEARNASHESGSAAALAGAAAISVPGPSDVARFFLDRADALDGLPENERGWGMFTDEQVGSIVRQLRVSPAGDRRVKLLRTLAVMRRARSEAKELLEAQHELLCGLSERLVASGRVDAGRSLRAAAAGVAPKASQQDFEALLRSYLDASVGGRESYTRLWQRCCDEPETRDELLEDLVWLCHAAPPWGTLVRRIGDQAFKDRFAQRSAQADRTRAALAQVHMNGARSVFNSPAARKAAEGLEPVIEGLRFGADKRAVNELQQCLQIAADYHLSMCFSDREDFCSAAVERIALALQQVEVEPTFLSTTLVAPALELLLEALKDDLEMRQSAATPRLEVDDVLRGVPTVPDARGLAVRVLDVRTDVEHATIEKIHVTVAGLESARGQSLDGADGKSPLAMRGGASREIRFTTSLGHAPSQLEIRSVSVRVAYSALGREREQTFQLEVPVAPAWPSWGPLVNRFAEGANCKSVDDRTMFFGRRELREELLGLMSKRTGGNCAFIHGERRSGKTSFLNVVRDDLVDASRLVVYLSLQLFNAQGDLVGQFAREVIRGLARALPEIKLELPRPGEEPAEILVDRLRAANDALRARQRGCVVLVVDEFTWIMDEGLSSAQRGRFLQLWKAMLENGLFNALVGSQDTIRALADQHPNEMARLGLFRLPYLAFDEMEALATEPLPGGGAMTHRGRSLARLFEWTGGHPFFTQSLMERVVDRVGSTGRPYIVATDIDDAVEARCRGDRRLNGVYFDGLLRAAGVEAGDREAEALMTRIAMQNREGRSSVRAHLVSTTRAEEVLRRLLEAQVVEQVAPSSLRLRVGLFGEWLRGGR